MVAQVAHVEDRRVQKYDHFMENKNQEGLSMWALAFEKPSNIIIMCSASKALARCSKAGTSNWEQAPKATSKTIWCAAIHLNVIKDIKRKNSWSINLHLIQSLLSPQHRSLRDNKTNMFSEHGVLSPLSAQYQTEGVASQMFDRLLSLLLPKKGMLTKSELHIMHIHVLFLEKLNRRDRMRTTKND